MSFLQPWMLVALPLALIPIVIHLINQRRYQSTQWAAMMFLLTANRMNRGYAKIRQWLILALRTLVIAMLIFAIGRPIASGMLGGSIASAVSGGDSANTIVLLDRSPSMQASTDGTSQSKLETGIGQIVDALETIGTERLILIESNSNSPRELASPKDLLDLPEAGPSDASADVPALLMAALDHINANQLGQVDVWVCSDLRIHDWRSDDGRWATLRDAFVDFGRRIRFRLLAFASSESAPGSSQLNRSVRISESALTNDDEGTAVVLSVVVRDESHASDTVTGDPNSKPNTVPLTLEIGDATSVVEVEMSGGIGKLNSYRVSLPDHTEKGHGHVSIPADLNPADNDFYFTFDTPAVRRTVIVTDDAQVGRVLKLAAEIPSDEHIQCEAEVIGPRDVDGISWEDISLLIWHAPLPKQTLPAQTHPGPTQTVEKTGAAEIINVFVQRGGRVIFLPPGSTTDRDFDNEIFGTRWKRWRELEDENQIRSWRDDTDLLADTLAGASLPVGQLRVDRVVGVEGDVTSLATLDEGETLLSRATTPRGGVYFCGTTPLESDSSLAADGVVLYVMIQRALASGAKALNNTTNIDAGTVKPETASRWKRLAVKRSALSSENAFVAGVFSQNGDSDLTDERLIAVNREADEDIAATLGDEQVNALFQGLPFVRVDRQAGGGSSLVEEVWRAFLITMLVAMIGEALLCLPKQRVEGLSRIPGGVSA
ncbi:BatA domain-containing protein [Rhodopirellula sallentina]|uniref:Membrane protein n=1 Tax=Rhodopirellula sallentina SM41 TaxID=1263870 RepID=M5UJ59_9BACT|nr:BatA domain-containing protein [Rhodopirellula sallentina]EMI57876.1 membrane protein [Rhodopirellula sallentina SM41]